MKREEVLEVLYTLREEAHKYAVKVHAQWGIGDDAREEALRRLYVLDHVIAKWLPR